MKAQHTIRRTREESRAATPRIYHRYSGAESRRPSWTKLACLEEVESRPSIVERRRWRSADRSL